MVKVIVDGDAGVRDDDGRSDVVIVCVATVVVLCERKSVTLNSITYVSMISMICSVDVDWKVFCCKDYSY